MPSSDLSKDHVWQHESLNRIDPGFPRGFQTRDYIGDIVYAGQYSHIDNHTLTVMIGGADAISTANLVLR